MNKYDIWFCSCGHFHAMPTKFFDWMSEECETRRVYRVCQSCGAVSGIKMEPYEEGYAIDAISDDNKAKELSTVSDNIKVWTSVGYTVPMKNGENATTHWSDKFIYEGSDDTCIEVDTDKLIATIKDSEVLRSLSSYVTNIDWKGTPYDQVTYF